MHLSPESAPCGLRETLLDGYSADPAGSQLALARGPAGTRSRVDVGVVGVDPTADPRVHTLPELAVLVQPLLPWAWGGTHGVKVGFGWARGRGTVGAVGAGAGLLT